LANISDVKPEHQRHARQVDQETLGRLSAAELRHRAAYAAQLHEAASQAQAEHARYLTARARTVMRSKPALQFIERDKELGQLAQGSLPPDPVGW